VKITLEQIDRTESEWGSRTRLRSIRGIRAIATIQTSINSEAKLSASNWRRLQKRFDNGIRHCFAFLSQHEIAVRLFK
jgi:hypothetical protein